MCSRVTLNSYVNAGFKFSQTLHQVISLSGCTSPSAGVIFKLDENTHVGADLQSAGLVEVTQRWALQRATAAAWLGQAHGQSQAVC